MLTLYDYYRSSASYRVRIALSLKSLNYESVSIDLKKAAQHADEYKSRNAQGLVPTLIDECKVVTQSLAIIEYLDELHPVPPLIYGDAEQKAYIRQLSQSIACDIHPLNNLRVMKYLEHNSYMDEMQRSEWSRHWCLIGLEAFEKQLKQKNWSGGYCLGEDVSMADICLIPQLYNARRIGLDLSSFSILKDIEKQCVALDAFQHASPEAQSDVPDDLEPIHGPKSPLLDEAV